MPKLKAVKQLLHRSLFALGFEIRRIKSPENAGATHFSYAGEEFIIKELLGKIKYGSSFVVDIGAGDGEYMSNSYKLFQLGWPGLAVEWNGQQFAKAAYRYAGFDHATLLRARITPENILDLLTGCETPKEFRFLSLDIDSYDYFVLEKILTAYRPALICTEINEKIPPPLRFAAKWLPDGSWGKDHFYGQSLSMVEDLARRNDYDLVQLEYNNAFFIRRELNQVPAITAEDAWHKGYVDRPDRCERFPWNLDMEPLITISAIDSKAFLREKFKQHDGQYVLD